MKKIDYKWIMLILVSVAYFLAQGTRLIYAAVLPQIKATFAAGGVSDAQLGLVGSAFTLVFGIVMPFAGMAADMLRRKWILVTGALLFSVGIFLSGFATGLGMLLIVYGVMNGIGQALMPPCNSSLIGQFHTDTRGTAFSIYQAAIYLGIVVCSVIAGRMASMADGGWRKAFWVFGAIVIAWAFVMLFFLKDTPNVGKRSEVSLGGALKAFFSKPTALLLMGALGCYFFTTYGVKTWAPMFMMRCFPDMEPATAVFHAVVWFYAGAFAGVTLSGRLSDNLKIKRPLVRFEVWQHPGLCVHLHDWRPAAVRFRDRHLRLQSLCGPAGSDRPQVQGHGNRHLRCRRLHHRRAWPAGDGPSERCLLHPRRLRLPGCLRRAGRRAHLHLPLLHRLQGSGVGCGPQKGCRASLASPAHFLRWFWALRDLALRKNAGALTMPHGTGPGDNLRVWYPHGNVRKGTHIQTSVVYPGFAGGIG